MLVISFRLVFVFKVCCKVGWFPTGWLTLFTDVHSHNMSRSSNSSLLGVGWDLFLCVFFFFVGVGGVIILFFKNNLFLFLPFFNYIYIYYYHYFNNLIVVC